MILEKAFHILSPVAKTIKDEEEDGDRTVIYGFRGTPVFGFQQTEGDPLPTQDADVDAWIRSLPLFEVAHSWACLGTRTCPRR